MQWLFPMMIVIASSSYGILSTIIKVAMGHGFTAEEAVSSQYIVGFALAFILVVFTQRKLPKLNRAGVLTLVFGGLFTGATGVVYGKALIYLPASLAVVMLFQFTWIGLFINCALKRRLPTRAEAISLAFLFAGTLLAAGVIGADISNIAWQGWVYGLLSALSFAIFIQINSRHVEGVSTITRMFFMSLVAMIATSLVLAPEIVWNGRLLVEGLWKYGLALGFFGIILPIILFSIAIPRVGGALASILSAMELPVAIMASVIVLGEQLTTLQLYGIVLVLIGMTLPTYLSMRKTERQISA